jgi:hypothetical protein
MLKASRFSYTWLVANKAVQAAAGLLETGCAKSGKAPGVCMRKTCCGIRRLMSSACVLLRCHIFMPPFSWRAVVVLLLSILCKSCYMLLDECLEVLVSVLRGTGRWISA